MAAVEKNTSGGETDPSASGDGHDVSNGSAVGGLDDIDWSRPVGLLYAVGLVDRGIQSAMQECLADHGLSTPEFSVLAVLRGTPGLSNAELARRALVTPQSMNEVITRLAERGLIDRTKHPEHGRILMTTLTDAGRVRLSEAIVDVGALEQRLTEGLSSSDRGVTLDYLLRMLSRLRSE